MSYIAAMIHVSCKLSEGRLFIDNSSTSLKAVLLNNTNKCLSIPLANSIHMKEEYENIKILLSAFKYDHYKWEVVSDFGMVAFLVGLQGSFTKFQCYGSISWKAEKQLVSARRGTDLHEPAMTLELKREATTTSRCSENTDATSEHYCKLEHYCKSNQVLC